MRRSVLWVFLGLCIVTGSMVLLQDGTGSASDIDPAFHGAWQRTDQPVADGQTDRTWMWGPEGHTVAFNEPYDEAPDSFRLVQYFDKSRMEITNPDGDPESVWYVTNGLLARELITGEMQIGDDSFENRAPALVHVAGDAHPDSPTYATFNAALDLPPQPVGSVINQTIDQDGNIETNEALQIHQVTAEYYVPETGHVVASIFWEFMNASGTVYSNGQSHHDQLFENPFFAVGLPITGAYWMHVPVGGEPQYVLGQCFERRCLTYTPKNPEGWRVEAGNIGQHYYDWRYEGVASPVQPPEDSDDNGDASDDSGNDISPPDNEDLGPPIDGACAAENQAVLSQVSDGIGNVNPNSWAQGTGGDWTVGIDASPTVSAGQQITISVSASGDCEPLEYRIQRYRPGQDVEIVRGWSQGAQFDYTFDPADTGEYLMFIVDVRNQDPRTHFDGRDDYTYLTYFVE